MQKAADFVGQSSDFIVQHRTT